MNWIWHEGLGDWDAFSQRSKVLNVQTLVSENQYGLGGEITKILAGVVKINPFCTVVNMYRSYWEHVRR